jgi:hypothetical protein
MIKLSLICLVGVSVLGATLATAGGGNITSFLLSTLERVIPMSPAGQSAGSTTIAQRVQPITQADLNAGYDSQQQHDIWWDSACSVAAMTEVLHAWGRKEVTIGRLIDLMSAHSPPFLTPWGGLTDQAGWPWLAQMYHFQAQVQWHAYTFDTLIGQVNQTGLPIIIGIQGSTGWGHFFVVVGGDSQAAQIVDSSLWHIHSMPRAAFSSYTPIGIDSPILWTGETVMIAPA